MGKIYHTCGHEDKYREVAGWPLRCRDYDDFGNRAVSFSSFCRDCYIKWIQDLPETVIFDDWEEREWFDGQEE